VIVDSTGPKISSRAMRIEGFTPSKTVGSTKHPPLSPRTRRPPSARRAIGLARLDVAEHALHLLRIDNRAEPRRRIERIARRQFAAKRFATSLEQRSLQALVHQQARAGGAHLALVEEDRIAAARAARSRSGNQP
jgi:hypothetical protein